MSKSKSANVVAIENSTTANLAYQYAKSIDAGLGIAQVLFTRYPKGLSEEAMSEVQSGFSLHYSESVHKPVTYLKEGADTYTVINRPTKGDEVTLVATAALALSYSSHDFGKLKAEQPNYHKIIGDVRTAESKYRSNKTRRLVADLKFLAANGGSTRKPNDEFATAAGKLVELLAKRAKNAAKNKDATAPTSKEDFKAAVNAIIDEMKW